MFSSILFELIVFIIPFVSTLSPLSLTKSVTDGFGVNIHFTHPKAGEMEMIAAAGFKFVRMDLSWQWTEQIKGQYYFNDYHSLDIFVDGKQYVRVFYPRFRKSTIQ